MYNITVNISSSDGFYTLPLNKKLLARIYFLEATNRIVKKVSVL
ncbi:hypothetical protein SAMN05428988_3941 [Chitinophaga sp. YR573]|nr:hypothetical protein [Chitinophaga sp. YR573]SEW28342.1 hypothetical protein SAMN05428988_3941 [Chitinophaga sp. YR573]